MMITFQSYSYSAKATFTCPSCGKEKRTRSFRAECTVNPFNTREDGQVRTASEVRAQSIHYAEKERDEFMSEPLCLTCENALTWKDRSDLNDRRRSVGAAA